MITNPPKKGTGYGYCDVTLGKPHRPRVPDSPLYLEKYHPHANEPYNRSRQLINEANAAHHRKVKGKAFKLNNHPGAFSFISTSCLTMEAISCKIMKTEISWLFWQKSVPTSKYQRQTAGRRRTKKPAKDQTVSDNFTFKPLLPKLSKGKEFSTVSPWGHVRCAQIERVGLFSVKLITSTHTIHISHQRKRRRRLRQRASSCPQVGPNHAQHHP